MISGALYHRVATYSVKNPVWFWTYWLCPIILWQSLVYVMTFNSKLTLARCALFIRLHKSSMFTFVLRMISGALYHRVATYSVKNPVWSWSGSATLARPKSQILRSQVVFSKRFEGFKSLCRTFAECMYLRPRRIWYKK